MSTEMEIGIGSGKDVTFCQKEKTGIDETIKCERHSISMCLLELLHLCTETSFYAVLRTSATCEQQHIPSSFSTFFEISNIISICNEFASRGRTS